jgi:hypothetical protein
MLSPGTVLDGTRLLWRLPGFLRHPISPGAAAAIVRRRRERRAADFLALVRRAACEHAASPYRALLRHAGCEYGDLERLVAHDGVEGALRALYRAGVYLTVEEFKGRRPAVRGAATIPVQPSALRNPAAAAHVTGQSSGSRGPRMPVPMDLAWLVDEAVNRGLTLAARGPGPWRLAYWDVPGGTLYPLLAYAKAGAPPVRWFSPVDIADRGLDPLYRWSARAIRWASRAAGIALPAPVHVPVDRPLPIARWLAEVVRAGAAPFLLTYSSPAVRLCEAARDAGLDLAGAHLLLYGEPVTDARLAVIRRAGAAAYPAYVATECGRMAEGCLAPDAADDVHLFDDLLALVQPGADGERPGLPADALLVSSLRPRAPLLLLNVSMGDRAVVRRRACGCPLDAHGWTTHLHAIRSFEKLTAGGMTFLDTDVIRVLDEVLPARFGGGPTHYQLVEEEMADGRPRVRLLVHPAVGLLDPGAVARAFLGAIGAGSGTERVMATVWRDADLLRVEREPPLTTASGKILHLHRRVAEPPRPSPAPAPAP